MMPNTLSVSNCVWSKVGPNVKYKIGQTMMDSTNRVAISGMSIFFIGSDVSINHPCHAAADGIVFPKVLEV